MTAARWAFSNLKSVSGTPMSLLRLASLQSTASFCLNTEATNSLVVVLPFDPPMAMIGSRNPFRYCAASRPSALRVSSTVMIAQFRLPLPFPLPSDGRGSGRGSRACSTTRPAAPFFAASLTKWCPSNRWPGNAKNKSPALAWRESVHTRRTSVWLEPLSCWPRQAVEINLSERGSIGIRSMVRLRWATARQARPSVAEPMEGGPAFHRLGEGGQGPHRAHSPCGHRLRKVQHLQWPRTCAHVQGSILCWLHLVAALVSRGS